MGEMTRSDWHDWGSHRIPKNAWFFINTPTFGTFFIQVDAPFETIRYCGFEWWNNCTVLIPQMVLNGTSANTKTLFGSFQMVVQLIQNLVWILLSGESMDPLKPFEWIWMVVQLATNTVQMVSPCVYKTNGHFWKWEFWMFSNGPSVGGRVKHTKSTFSK